MFHFSRPAITPEPRQLQQLVARWQRCESLCFAAVSDRMQQDSAAAAAAPVVEPQGELSLQQLKQQQEQIQAAERRAAAASTKCKLLQHHCAGICLQQLAHMLPES
ncbi:hypothetical protein cyc_08665 [Cyclospora cayetanensis]|uniref:Uncharacterized protein n=1 Tax=Cyclospora cayetanensis TaxID=88456 RepID=A0A1D3CWV4_9EIME|nr:hypothetical protein cyc_08665 [Cyclospora cayetanensis]